MVFGTKVDIYAWFWTFTEWWNCAFGLDDFTILDFDVLCGHDLTEQVSLSSGTSISVIFNPESSLVIVFTDKNLFSVHEEACNTDLKIEIKQSL